MSCISPQAPPRPRFPEAENQEERWRLDFLLVTLLLCVHTNPCQRLERVYTTATTAVLETRVAAGPLANICPDGSNFQPGHN